jgi:1,4-alpha-glucan branching enzyme
MPDTAAPPMPNPAHPCAPLPEPSGMAELLAARHHDPFALLGLHPWHDRFVLRLLRPHARRVLVIVGTARLPMQRRADTDLFELELTEALAPQQYQYESQDSDGQVRRFHDAYRLGRYVTECDAWLFGAGEHCEAWRFMGAQVREREGLSGVQFVLWAPNAERVSVVGDFNHWDGRTHALRSLGESGLWELFIPDLDTGQPYKYEIRNRHTGHLSIKMDPYARQAEHRPATASLIPAPGQHRWADQAWLAARRDFDWQHRPVSIYEVHLGTWRRAEGGGFLNYRELARALVSYVRELGYTHVQLLPIAEHPFDGSWGYQVTGYFAPTSRFGTPEDFAWFVDHLHQHHIGVFLDWVPAHFPKDAHALARFDGSALYEHEDPLLGEHRDWGTLIFNYGRKEVQSFLISSALYWLDEFHLDGLRVDAVASMLYLDYSRQPGEWRPNRYGGNENLEAVAFLKKLNERAHERFPGVLMMAEESTSWPRVSHPTYVGGLGFSMKWNMGWMNDTLQYFCMDPVYRQYHHDKLTFSLLYAFSENFILPLSHDEVVHLKKSLLGKMPGDTWQQFANLRLLLAFQFTWPGKKLLFMGADLAQYDEWNHDQALQWELLRFPLHQGIRNLVAALNRCYVTQPALHQNEFSGAGFEWINCHDSSQSILSYLRRSDQGNMVVLLNFTPVPRHGYRIGVPEPGFYRELLNTDAAIYGGSNVGNAGGVEADAEGWGAFPCSLSLTVPPLGALLLKRDG